jgi:formate hydrogenlyase subunit 6/NADH:ubiquinone oxidoreductase subunit I
VYEIDMLRCIFCGDCEEACPKEAIFLTDRMVESNYLRTPFVFGKDELVEPRIPPTRGCEQTPDAGCAEVQAGDEANSHNR